MSFQDLFTHPWVDLEHMPSGESAARAVSSPVGTGWGEGRLGVSSTLLVVTRWLAPGGSAGAQGTCSVPVVVAVTPDLPVPVPQTALVVQAVKKDQEGDAVAALSLYCKALDFFVPALRCECRGCACRGGAQPALHWLGSRSSSPARILWETR